MNNDNNTLYPDSKPDGLGELKEIKRLPSMKVHAPNIIWGGEFDKMSPAKQLQRAKRVASAMNHAADILQTERNAMIKVAKDQEILIAKLSEEKGIQDDLLHDQLLKHNKDTQEMCVQLVEKSNEIKGLKKRLKELGDGDSS